MNLFELAIANSIASGLGAIMLQERIWRKPAAKQQYISHMKRLRVMHKDTIKRSPHKRAGFKEFVKDLKQGYKKIDDK